jgi:hypothetical protein
MRIAYLTTDDVNASLALRGAAAAGLLGSLLPPRAEPSPADFAAAVYDLDFLPADRVREVLAALRRGEGLVRAAVHGYNLDDRQIKALRARGVIVARRLAPGLFRKLRQALLSRFGDGDSLRLRPGNAGPKGGNPAVTS